MLFSVMAAKQLTLSKKFWTIQYSTNIISVWTFFEQRKGSECLPSPSR